MASDIRLHDNAVVVTGDGITLDRGPEQNSLALNLKNPHGF
jgi:hypothetical protein